MRVQRAADASSTSPTTKDRAADKSLQARTHAGTFTLGLYNKSGIIVGFSNLSSPATLYIYDSQCPNCYYETQTMSHRLTMDTRALPPAHL